MLPLNGIACHAILALSVTRPIHELGMTATQVEFTSYIDKAGYKIVPAKRAPRRSGQSEADRVLNTPLREWNEARIVGLGGGKRTLRLSSNYPLLYLEFTNVGTPEELLDFITNYGPLAEKNEVPQLLDIAKRMKGWLRERRLPPWPVVDLKASFSTDKAQRTVTIKHRPARLLDALWLQLGEALSGGAQFRECEHCGDWFPVGGKSGRRLVARFCSDKHRIEFNSLERSR